MRVTCVVEVPLIVTFVCQPNSWLCGPFALKHGLLLAGLRADEEEIARIAGTDRTGTDETELARAAGHFGCSLGSVRRRDAEAAKRDLTRLLADTTPVLLCIEQWDHWVVAAHEEEGTFVVLDSRAPAIFRVLPWEYLRELLVYRRGRHTRIYDLHPLEACGDRALRPVFTVSRAQFLQQWENRPIAQGWYGYLRDALAIVNGGGEADTQSLLPGVFFGRYEPALLEALAPTNDGGRRTAARREMRGLRFLADTYGLRLDPADEEAARQRLEEVMRRRLREQPVPDDGSQMTDAR